MQIALFIFIALIVIVLAWLLFVSNGKNARLTAENARMSARLAMLDKEQDELREQSRLVFQDVASRILSDRSRELKDANEERLNKILAPFKAHIDSLHRSIRDYNTAQVGFTASLQQQIKDLSEINRSIGADAKQLTQALKGDSKVQGDWGEMILKQILDKSGLEEGTNYASQVGTLDGQSLKNDDGARLRPDVVLFLPENKRLVVDSKVSLTAYNEYVNAENDKDAERALKRHIDSVRKHVNELCNAQYNRYVPNSADFVMMFIPIEPAYLLAVKTDHALWEYAYNRNVVIVSPTHLVSVVKLMNQLWARERQTKNATLIAQESGKLYDKLCGFVTDLQNLEKTLQNAQKAYDSAWSKLSTGNGNILSKAEKIKALGAKAQKQLPE